MCKRWDGVRGRGRSREMGVGGYGAGRNAGAGRPLAGRVWDLLVNNHIDSLVSSLSSLLATSMGSPGPLDPWLPWSFKMLSGSASPRCSRRVLFALFFFISSCLPTLHAQTISTSMPVPPLQWIELTNLLGGQSVPPPLKDASIGYDDTNRLLLIFGGESQSGFPTSQTYMYVFASPRWKSLFSWPCSLVWTLANCSGPLPLPLASGPHRLQGPL